MADVSQGLGLVDRIRREVVSAPSATLRRAAASPAGTQRCRDPGACGPHSRRGAKGQTAGVPWLSTGPLCRLSARLWPSAWLRGHHREWCCRPQAYAPNPGVRVDEALHLSLAPWWKRFLAFLIDSMMLGVAFFIILAVIAAAPGSSNTSTTNNQPLTPGQAIVGFTSPLHIGLHPLPPLLRHQRDRLKRRQDVWGS